MKCLKNIGLAVSFAAMLELGVYVGQTVDLRSQNVYNAAEVALTVQAPFYVKPAVDLANKRFIRNNLETILSDPKLNAIYHYRLIYGDKDIDRLEFDNLYIAAQYQVDI